MELTSYLLGKKAGGGGGEQSYNATIGDITVNDDIENYIINIDTLNLKDTAMSNLCNGLSNLVEVKKINCNNIVTNLYNFFSGCRKLKNIGSIENTNSLTSCSSMFNNCSQLVSGPIFNTSSVTNMSYMFAYCINLENVPEYDTSSVTNFSYMFASCTKVTDESLYNILEMCINATSYTGTKKLSTLGISDSKVTSRIYRISNYQDFLNAGWTIN